MKNGYKPRQNHKDYSFLPTYGFTQVPTLPESFTVDAGLTMPNQELPDNSYTPPVPALEKGCTSYAQTELCTDEDAEVYSPLLIENITHSNERGGVDIREALSAAKKVFSRTAYFNIQPSGVIDAFDAVRLAMYSALPEKRAVSIGTPWYSQWAVVPTGILPMPPMLLSTAVSWHNWAIMGWKQIDGKTYLVGKSWQGRDYGDKGFHYISRDVFNSVMSVKGSVAFTLSKTAPNQIQTIDLTIVATIVSFIRNLLHL